MKINRKTFVIIFVTLLFSALFAFARTECITGYFNVKIGGSGDTVQAVGAKIIVINGMGKIVCTRKTGEDGRAIIENLPFPGVYIVSLEGYDQQIHRILPFPCTYDITL